MVEQRICNIGEGNKQSRGHRKLLEEQDDIIKDEEIRELIKKVHQ